MGKPIFPCIGGDEASKKVCPVCNCKMRPGEKITLTSDESGYQHADCKSVKKKKTCPGRQGKKKKLKPQ